ncbi:hypothetical protein TRVL_05019 [Trypanosoma vivax]|nr:hypothetical protein TRVL_05019 [Trypanosoma vivax]
MKINSLVGPATSAWCQGLVLRPGESQAPALHPVRKDWGGQEADNYQRGNARYHRCSVVDEDLRILPCTCGSAALDSERLLLLVFGGVERYYGSQMRGTQWNSGGLSQEKRVALERKLLEDIALFFLFPRQRS